MRMFVQVGKGRNKSKKCMSHRKSSVSQWPDKVTWTYWVPKCAALSGGADCGVVAAIRVHGQTVDAIQKVRILKHSYSHQPHLPFNLKFQDGMTLAACIHLGTSYYCTIQSYCKKNHNNHTKTQQDIPFLTYTLLWNLAKSHSNNPITATCLTHMPNPNLPKLNLLCIHLL